MGQHAYHPKRIISILIYAYNRSVFSAREIQKRCNEDLSFMYIAQRNCPNFRVLNDFRKDNAAREAIEAREQEINPDKPIDGKKQISFADKEARIMGKRGGTFEYAYNAQISVDKDHQIIVGQHISQQANDVLEVEPALEQIQAATGRLPDVMSLDNGYMSSNESRQYLVVREIVGIILWWKASSEHSNVS